MTEAPTLAERVRARRRELELSQEQLAAASGCCTSTVQNLERGRHRPRSDVLQRIATTLGLKLDELPPASREAS